MEMIRLNDEEWQRVQHYKSKVGPWYKHHYDLARKFEISTLPDHEKAHVFLVYGECSRRESGVKFDLNWLKRQIQATRRLKRETFENAGVFVIYGGQSKDVESLESPRMALEQSKANPSKTLLSKEYRARTRKRTRERCARESALEKSFTDFWVIWPIKKGREEAWRRWKALKPDDTLTMKIKEAVAAQSKPGRDLYPGPKGERKQFVPRASTWLNGKRWEDEEEMPSRPDPAPEPKIELRPLSEKDRGDWEKFKAALEEKIDPESFEIWIKPTTALGWDGKTFVIGVPSSISRNWLASHYGDLISEEWEKASGEFAEIGFEIYEENDDEQTH